MVKSPNEKSIPFKSKPKSQGHRTPTEACIDIYCIYIIIFLVQVKESIPPIIMKHQLRQKWLIYMFYVSNRLPGIAGCTGRVNSWITWQLKPWDSTDCGRYPDIRWGGEKIVQCSLPRQTCQDVLTRQDIVSILCQDLNCHNICSTASINRCLKWINRCLESVKCFLLSCCFMFKNEC